MKGRAFFCENDPLFRNTFSKLLIIIKTVPTRAILQKEVDVVRCLREIYELNDIFVMNGLPCFNFSFQGMNKIFLC